jgi:hypothetical protein
MSTGASIAYTRLPEESDADLFEMLPMAHGPWPGRAAEAERRLLVAVLADAIACYQAPRRRGRDATRTWTEARDWLSSRERVSVFSFENLCDALGLDAEAIRRRVLSVRDPASGRPSLKPCRSSSGGLRPRTACAETPIARAG